jgi:O-antigen/teichoic acid export membrane protein
MRPRWIIAFFVGATLFAVVPYFDSEMPGEGEMGELFISVALGLVVGATVVLIAGHWRVWSLALAATLAGALAAQVYYEVALEPPPTDGLDLGSLAFETFFTFVFSAPFVLIGVLVVGAALALASTLRRA